MSPSRVKKFGQYTIEEFWWAGKFVVYVNNRKSELPFDTACRIFEKRAMEEGEPA